MRNIADEEKLLKHLTPRIEKIVYRTVKNMLPTEKIYPPESNFRKKFIENVGRAEKRVKQGKCKKFKDVKQLKGYLKSLAR